MHELADDQGHDDRRPGRKYGARRIDERAGDNHAENGVDHQEHEENDDHEQRARALADDVLGQRPDGLALVACAGPQRAEVMHAGKKYRAERHPQDGWDPTPVNGDGRPDDRRGTGDRREMMTPQHVFVGRVIVDTIVELMRRRHEIRVELVNFRCDKPGVNKPAESHPGDSEYNDHDGLHSFFLMRAGPFCLPELIPCRSFVKAPFHQGAGSACRRRTVSRRRCR